MRPTLLLLAAGSCQVLTPCVDPRLELWCLHSEQEEGPVIPEGTSDPVCDPPALPDDATTCGEYQVASYSGGFTGVAHYFRDGEHVATRYFTDVNKYCGGFTFWYGRKIECE